MYAKNFMTSKLPISKTKKNIPEQISLKYALLYTQVSRVQTWEHFLVFAMCQIHLAFNFYPVGRLHIFFRTVPYIC